MQCCFDKKKPNVAARLGSHYISGMGEGEYFTSDASPFY
jgi:CTP-dependent riboflavin kinase